MVGSISTATTRGTPLRSAPAASFPVPAPTINMLFGAGWKRTGRSYCEYPRCAAGNRSGSAATTSGRKSMIAW